MDMDARKEVFDLIELYDKAALFTNLRINRSTLPEGFYCYDLRGSDEDAGSFATLEEQVIVNHAGTVLIPEEIIIPNEGFCDIWEEIGFTGGNMT